VPRDLTPMPWYQGQRASQVWPNVVLHGAYGLLWNPPAPSTEVAEVAEVDVPCPPLADTEIADTYRDSELSIELVAGLNVRRRRWLWWIGQAWMRIHVRRRR
jgi:hypothetical protein